MLLYSSRSFCPPTRPLAAVIELRLLKATARIEALVILKLPVVTAGQHTGVVATRIEVLRQRIVAAG